MTQQTQSQALAVIKKGLIAKKDDVALVAPKGTIPDRFITSAYDAIAGDASLQQCTPASLVLSTMLAAQVGLEIDPTLQEAHLIAYWNNKKGCNEAKLIPGYRGILKLSQQHPDVDSARAVVVTDKDHFHVELGSAPKIEHTPELIDPGAIVGVYGIVYLRHGPPLFEWMTVKDVEKVRASVKGSSNPSSPWTKHWPEMAKKTVLKRVLKVAPKNPHTATVIAQDDAPFREDELEALPPEPVHVALDPAPVDAEVVEPGKQRAEEPPPPQDADTHTVSRDDLPGEPPPLTDAEEAALLGLGWEEGKPVREDAPGEPIPETPAPSPLKTETPTTPEQQQRVRGLLKDAKATQPAKAKKWLAELLGREVGGLKELTLGDLVTLLEKTGHEGEAADVAFGTDGQGEML